MKRLRHLVRWGLGEREPRLCRVASWISLYAVIFMTWLIVRPGGQDVATPFFNMVEIVPALFASASCIIFALQDGWRDRRYRLAWFVLGMGAFSFAMGQSTWTCLESILHIDPYPSLADIGYLGVYPLTLFGLTIIASPRQVLGKAKLMLDTVIVLGSAFALSWYFVLQPLFEQTTTPSVEKTMGLAYPMGDLGLLFCATVITMRSSHQDRVLKTGLRFLVAGTVGLAFADTVFAYLTLQDTYQTGSFNDPGWAFGWMLIGYAALYQLWHPQLEKWVKKAREAALSAGEEAANFSYTSARILVPFFVAFGTLVTIYLVDWYRDNYLDRKAVLIGFGLIALVVIRQILTMLENGHLYRQLQGFNQTLERKVAERTHQLSTLHEITAGVSTTLRSEEVLRIALTKTLSAIRADAGAIWRFHEGKGFQVAIHRGFPSGEMAAGLLTPEEASAIRGLCGKTLHFPDSSSLEMVYVPLQCRGRILGIFGAARHGSLFEPEEQSLVESVAMEVGVALENARLYAEAVQAADTDSVTGLLNHRAIQQRLATEFIRARDRESTFAIIMMDLDNFKLFNDTYGHPVGDQVLKNIASILSSVCQSPNMVGRYGGDEFIALLPSADASSAQTIAEAIRERIHQEGFSREGEDRIIPISLSFGIALFPEDSQSRYELLTIADANLYRSKYHGGEIILSSRDHRLAEEKSAREFGALEALVSAVNNKDHYTRHHSEEVTEYSLLLATEMGLSEDTMRTIRIAGLLHDLGKIVIPDSILRKPGRFSDEEFNIMKYHPVLGAQIVGAVTGWEAPLDGIRYHHERYDGKGYPEGLTGEDIPLLGRLMAVADSYSAMTTDRPYRKALSQEAALAELRKGSGSQFDPIIVEAFLSAMQKRSAAEKELVEMEAA